MVKPYTFNIEPYTSIITKVGQFVVPPSGKLEVVNPVAIQDLISQGYAHEEREEIETEALVSRSIKRVLPSEDDEEALIIAGSETADAGAGASKKPAMSTKDIHK